jgi:hypothetical protein
MRDNRKKNNKLKFTLVAKESVNQEQPKHVVLQVHDSNLTSKTNDINGGK